MERMLPSEQMCAEKFSLVTLVDFPFTFMFHGTPEDKGSRLPGSLEVGLWRFDNPKCHVLVNKTVTFPNCHEERVSS